eukprot:scaffold33_cov48-Attheya_sp.AAC.2
MSIEEYEREKPHRLVDLEIILSRREGEEMLMELGEGSSSPESTSHSSSSNAMGSYKHARARTDQ